MKFILKVIMMIQRMGLSKRCLSFFALLGVLMGAGSNTILLAQTPGIRIDLKFVSEYRLGSGRPLYRFGDPVVANIVVTNISERNILISEGFRSKSFYKEMRVIDPGHRLLLAKRKEPHQEFPNAPPLPFALHQGRPVRVAPCEDLPYNRPIRQRVDDLRKYYPMELPGHYSAQVQISAMVFKEEICDIHNYKWLGILKSNVEYFYMEGKTKVRVTPEQWNLAWKTRAETLPIEVSIYPAEERRMDDYQIETIRLNGLSANRVEKLKTIIKATFEPKACIESLGQVEAGRSYPIVISGRLRSGQPFGGGQMIRIAKITGPSPPSRLKVD